MVLKEAFRKNVVELNELIGEVAIKMRKRDENEAKTGERRTTIMEASEVKEPLEAA